MSAPMTPEEHIANLYQLVVDLEARIGDLENVIFYLRQDINGKAGESHSHHEYADSRHSHDLWEMQR